MAGKKKAKKATTKKVAKKTTAKKSSVILGNLRRYQLIPLAIKAKKIKADEDHSGLTKEKLVELLT